MESIGVGGSWKTITGQWIGVGGSWKFVTQKWIGVGGVWKLCYSALTATASNVNKTGSGSSSSGSVTSDATQIISVSGGSGSYSYSYAQISGDSQAIQPGTQTTHSPRFTATVTEGDPSSAVWEVTVTDATYGNSTTDQFNVVLTWIDLT
jgi:hypothetical protein